MPKAINYPLNYKKAIDWTLSHCDRLTTQFAKQIIEKTVYINFAFFIERLKKICISFKRNYVEQKNNIYILILPFTINKSNLWVSMLCHELIGDMLDDVYFSVTDVYNYYIHDKNAGDKNVVCIVCDDCAYTGSQVNSYCSLLSTKIKYKNKPVEPESTSREWLDWRKKIIDDTVIIEKTLDIRRFSINLLIPFIGSMAMDIVLSNKYIMLPKDIKNFKTFREEINTQDYPQNVLNEFEQSFQYHTNISAIYFDHKIADAVSTFNKVYLLAPVFNCNITNLSSCFIDGCSNDKKIPDHIKIYDTYVNVEDKLEGKACPPTFYKSIKYTYNGQIIDCFKNVKKVFNELLKQSVIFEQ